VPCCLWLMFVQPGNETIAMPMTIDLIIFMADS